MIQFPGRASRSFVAGAGGTSASYIRVVNESAAGSHPMLSRGLQASGRYSRPGSTRSRMAGIDEYRALMQSSQGPAFLLNQLGGRLVLGDPAAQHFGREENGADSGWSRWTDDGGGSNAAMRSLSLGLEACIQTALSSSRQLSAMEGVTALPAPVTVEANASDSSVLPTALTSTPGLVDRLPSSSSSFLTAEATAGENVAMSSSTIEVVNADAPTGLDFEDRTIDDNEELALALRLSMETGNSSNAVPTDPNGGELGHDNDVSMPENENNDVQTNVPTIDSEGLEIASDANRDAEPSIRNEEESAIDAAFLAELPDELRAEVIAQQSSSSASRWLGGASAQSNTGNVVFNFV